MELTPRQKSLCERVINAFETSNADGDYDNISIFHDGPNGIRQVTYGRSQTTEYGNLDDLVARYVAASGTFSGQLASYAPLIGHTPLVDDQRFKSLLRQAGSDPVMQRVQDEFFESVYFQPALKWAEANGFKLALSMLTIYDSYIHSGSILKFLRARFPEVPPAKGGDEKTWIRQYVEARQNWLANADNPDLHATIYRTRCLKTEISRGNWDLSQVPILANGVSVWPKVDGVMVVELAPGEIPFLGDPHAGETAIDPVGFASRVVQSALDQWTYFGKQTQDVSGHRTHSGHAENENPYYLRVGEYWAVVGEHFDGRDRDQPWSAAFISYLMKTAGAASRFAYSAQHSQYISKAIRDRKSANADAGYWAYRLDEKRPMPGDVVCWARGDDLDVDFDNQKGGDYSGHCDLVVSVGTNSVDVIGGNVGQSVTRRPLALDGTGHLEPVTIAGEKLFAFMANRIA